MRQFVPSVPCLLLSTVVFACGSSAFAVEPPVRDAEAARVSMIERVATSVVAIFASSGDGGGSGVLISPDGYALSNFHVTSGSGDFMKCGLNDGRLYDAVIVGIDPTGDVALIKLLGRDDFPAATLGDSDNVRVGEWVFAMGNPFLLATDFHPTVTAGIVSGVHRYQYPAGTFLEYADCIQTDASINPGNSGGPLFNAAGELIGINGRGSFEKRGRVNIGAGYAISINQIKRFLDGLKGGRIVDHATLGATVSTNFDREVVVDRILEQSSAYRRGLREGDQIVSFGGRPIGSANQFKNVLGIYPDGWKVPLTYRRGGERHDLLVELRTLHRASEMLPERERKPEGPRRPGKPDDKSPPPEDPHAHPPTPVAAPEAWKHLYEERDGFANYHFNRLAQARLLKGLAPYAELKSLGGRWKVAGTVADGRTFVFTLAKEGLGLKVGKDGVYYMPLDGSEPIDEPPGSGGLLVACDQFKQLLTREPESFSFVQYLGSEPLDGVGPAVEVLQTQVGVVHTRWLFHREEGRLVGFDTTLARDVDPCEFRIQSVGEFNGRHFPSSFSVRSGDREFATFRVNAAEFLPTPPPETR
ncbi:MAG: trypsin-like peptidase domain-containing protein [Planctomycetaceae bacterium]|nr:trypsin-like peptidase domain-containing protein [Planctomycetaceae bacterium]